MPEENIDKLALLQDGDYVEHRGLKTIEKLGPIWLQDGHVLYRSHKFKGLTIAIQQHRILAIIRNQQEVHRFAEREESTCQ